MSSGETPQARWRLARNIELTINGVLRSIHEFPWRHGETQKHEGKVERTFIISQSLLFPPFVGYIVIDGVPSSKATHC